MSLKISMFTSAQVLEIKGDNFVNSIKWMHNKSILETELQEYLYRQVIFQN